MADQHYSRKFLVLVDESPECDRAVTFAANRVKRVGGALVLLSVIDTQDFDQFIGVADTMRAEARNEAERNLDARIARIAEFGQIRTETVIREGRPAEAIERLVSEDPAIGIVRKLRDGKFLTRDSRMKERKKYGLRGARRGTQFSKR